MKTVMEGELRVLLKEMALCHGINSLPSQLQENSQEISL
jgi:hypothetical protein